MNRFLTILALLLALSACTRSRQADVHSPDDGRLIVSDALSNQRVNAFTEDSDGHIWIATFRGLNQYDVHEYHQYFHTDDTLGLPDNQVNDIYGSRSGRLWAATAGGVAYRTGTGEFHPVPVMGENSNFRRILETPDGKMLFSNSETLFLYDEAREILSPVVRDFDAFGLPSETLDGDRLWAISGRTRLNCYETGGFSLVESVPIPFSAYHICYASGGELWLSGIGNLAIYDVNAHAWKDLPQVFLKEPRIMKGDIDYIFAVDDKTLLLNAIGSGMFCWQRSAGRLLHQSDPTSLMIFPTPRYVQFSGTATRTSGSELPTRDTSHPTTTRTDSTATSTLPDALPARRWSRFAPTTTAGYGFPPFATACTYGIPPPENFAASRFRGSCPIRISAISAATRCSATQKAIYGCSSQASPKW